VRLSGLTEAVVDEAFAALPGPARSHYEDYFAEGAYTPARIDEKKEHVKENLEALRAWERKYA